ncbi:type II 3-dehydroquinate dehydratase [Alloscardovia macacae]|uniref:3-dehydroquinate dehydratase n=1 Tax=Alloscardovia macacae TaxID=1160091 RepID=A0A1Y2SVS2_9BIFI|nr:type II 3-dehydroquinate dehydratase [Alloscardovia macacae]OTA26332.1 type II 3-dehydroquinate dehydratase [Alloscardovia macacae]OTA28398.1 type II 3-dehydroquinate dehydratase [Alloscardovia macacae]
MTEAAHTQETREAQNTPKIIVVNGPNLGRLGVREPEIYGSATLEDLADACTRWGEELGIQVEVRQSDDEAEVIRWMHQAVDEKTPIVLNPAAFTHYSYGLADAAAQVTDEHIPLIEVHISNPASREAFRKHSVISPIATATIAGMGFYGYKLALESIVHLLEK